MTGRTYTTAFSYERRLYGVFDLQLPAPVTYLQLGVFTAVEAVCLAVLPRIGLPPGVSTLWLYLAAPGLAAWVAGMPAMDGRPVWRWMIAQATYLVVDPRRLVGLRRLRDPVRLTVHGHAYTPGRARRPRCQRLFRRLGGRSGG